MSKIVQNYRRHNRFGGIVGGSCVCKCASVYDRGQNLIQRQAEVLAPISVRHTIRFCRQLCLRARFEYTDRRRRPRPVWFRRLVALWQNDTIARSASRVLSGDNYAKLIEENGKCLLGAMSTNARERAVPFG